MIKAVFFDIDGTLISMKTRKLLPSTLDTLYKLKDNGIRLFISSGRPPIQLPLLGEDFNAFPWDGWILLNGQYCMDAEKNVYRDHPIPKEALTDLIPWIKETADYACTFNELDYSYDIRFNQGMYEYLHSIGKEDQMTKVDDPERCFTHPTYQICPYFGAERDAEFLQHAKGLKSARWNPNFADIIPADGGKPVGMKVTLERYGIQREECMAFGDGGNDITMLEYAGIGVAMGNAADDVKKHADFVTVDCEQDGITYAIQHLHILG